MMQVFGPKSGFDWGGYLTKLGGDALGGVKQGGDHAHHIVMRVGKGAKGQAAVRESHAILRQYGIDPFWSRENFVWARSIGHTDEYAMVVRDHLRQVVNEGTMMGWTAAETRAQLAKRLAKIGWFFREYQLPLPL